MKFTINGDIPQEFPLTPKQQQLIDYLAGMPDGKLLTLRPLIVAVGTCASIVQDMFPELLNQYRTSKKAGRGYVWGNPRTVKAYKEQG